MKPKSKGKPTLPSGALSATLTLATLCAVQTVHAQNLFVGEATGEILKFAPNGTSTTFAPGLAIESLALNSSGDLFEGDMSAVINEFAPNGTKTVFSDNARQCSGI